MPAIPNARIHKGDASVCSRAGTDHTSCSAIHLTDHRKYIIHGQFAVLVRIFLFSFALLYSTSIISPRVLVLGRQT